MRRIAVQAFLPLLGSKQDRVGKPGRVVFIGSIYGSYGLPWQSAYCKPSDSNPACDNGTKTFVRL